jgi:hypothetical protein
MEPVKLGGWKAEQRGWEKKRREGETKEGGKSRGGTFEKNHERKK